MVTEYVAENGHVKALPICFRRVSRQRPCPVCGGMSECYYLPSGDAVVCTRVESDRPIKDAIKSVAYLHRVSGEPAVPVLRLPQGPTRGADRHWGEAKARLWLRDGVSGRRRGRVERALDAYCRGRGFAEGLGILGPQQGRVPGEPQRANLRPALHLAPVLGTGAADGHYYVAWPVTVPRGPEAAAVLALTPEGTQGRPAAWGGAPRRTYGPRRMGSHTLLYPLRDDLPALGPALPGERYVCGEGLETTMAAMLAMGGQGVVCWDAGHLAGLLRCREVLDNLRESSGHMVIAADRDRSGAGQRAAAACAALAQEAGIAALVLLPPAEYGDQADWADVLQRAGQTGAEEAAIAAAQVALAEREAAATAAVATLPYLRRVEGAAEPVAVAPEADLEGSREALAAEMGQFVAGEGPRLRTISVQPGRGKSHAIAAAVRASGEDTPSLVVTGTRDLRAAAAEAAGAVQVPARSANPSDPGYCAYYEDEVQVLASKHRSIAAHACQSCPLGQATGDRVREYQGAGVPIRPQAPRGLSADGLCPYIWHLRASEEAARAVATAAKLQGDDGVATQRVGEHRRVARALVLDDVPGLVEEVEVRADELGEWVRVSQRQAAADEQAAADATLPADERKRRGRRAELLRAAHPQLQRLLAWLAEHAGLDHQVPLAPEDWIELTNLVGDPRIAWVDATGAEAILRRDDGQIEIPLRALQQVAEAIAAGTCWLLRGRLRALTPSQATRMALAGSARMLWADATQPQHVERLVSALGGEVGAVEPQPANLHVALHLAGNHGKVACHPDQPSYQRERDHFWAAVRADAMALREGQSLCVLAHMAFACAVAGERGREIGEGESPQGYVFTDIAPGRTVYLGWWGRHSRGHNAWLGCAAITCWGVLALGPESAERQWTTAESIVARAGGEADSTWCGDRTERWYAIPGTDLQMQTQGYVREDIDAWARAWTTAELVQGLGRLRAVARPGETLVAHVYTSAALSADYGLRIATVDSDAPWRTARAYQAARREDTLSRGRQAVAALQAAGQRVSRRSVNSWLVARGQQQVSSHLWAAVQAVLDANIASTPPSTTPGSAHKHLYFALVRRVGAGMRLAAASVPAPSGGESGAESRSGWRARVLSQRLRGHPAASRGGEGGHRRGAG